MQLDTWPNEEKVLIWIFVMKLNETAEEGIC